MKKKIRADSVDELFEIVKAIQNGEEPEAYTKRRAEEQRRAEEERRAEEKRRVEEQRRAEEQRRTEEKRRIEEQRRTEEQERKAQKRSVNERRAQERMTDERKSEELIADERLVREGEAAKREAAGQEKPVSSRQKQIRREKTAGSSDEERSEAFRAADFQEMESSEEEEFERLLDEEEPEQEFGEVRAIVGEAAERLKEAGSLIIENVQEGRGKIQQLVKSVVRKRTTEEEPQEKQTAQGQDSDIEAAFIHESDIRERESDRSGKTGLEDKEDKRDNKKEEKPEETPEETQDNRQEEKQKNNQENKWENNLRDDREDNRGKNREDPLKYRTEDGKEERTGSKKNDQKEEHTGNKKGDQKEERTGSKKDDQREERTARTNGRPTIEDDTADEDIHSMGRVRLADIERMPVGKTRRRYGANTVSEEAESVGRRILHSLHMEPSDEKPTETSEKNDGSVPADSRVPENASVGADSRMPENASVGADSRVPENASVGADSRVSENVSAGADNAAPAEESADMSIQAPADEPAQNRDAPANGQKISGHVRDFTVRIQRAWSGFFENGIGKKQAAVLGAVLLIAVLLVCFVVSAIRQTVQLHEKQKYVTADAGLTVTVENQPKTWCNTWDLELKFSVKQGTISAIMIDGTVYEPDESGIVTVTAATEQLQASVATGEKILTAVIELPKLDAGEPVLTVEKSGGKIELSAEDSRSGISSIWYAEVEDDDWVQLPQYRLYSDSITWEEGKTYYFYAEDLAGNHSTPVVTTMEDAQSLALSETELSLFPGETAYVQAEVTPSGALLENVSYKSSNTEVVTVSSSGLVTAVGDGTALVSADADGVDAATCSVTVASSQEVTISAIGDCTLGSYSGMLTSVSFDTYYTLYGASYFFQNVQDVLENDDATFANLEGPLTDAATAVEKEYAFKGDPSYTEILQDGSIEVVTLANNHSGDYGSEGLEDTKENLTEAGIDYCTGDTIAYQQISGVKVAFIGIYELASGLECESQVRSTIAEAQSEGAKLIIVAFHWGSEKETSPDETQQSLAHTAIDCGADLVVGHHPHVLQGIEKYNGKYIVYSLGNFCFGGNSNPSDKDTMIFRQTFTVTQDGTADDDAIEIIPCTLSSVSGSNDYRPTVATGSAADEIMERINEYSAEFGDITYTASTGL